MPNFPSFILTGETKNLSDAPLEVKPLNLLPLIELMRQEGKTAGSSGSSKKSGDDKESKVEGRIGAVNQYMSTINNIQNKMNRGLDLYGASFTSLPEYSSLVRQLDAAESPERLNIIQRETKNVDQYKTNTKDKGSFFDVSAMMNGLGVKKVSDWTQILEYGNTDALGGKGGQYQEGFDFNPNLISSGDALVKLKEYFAGAGQFTLENDRTSFVEDMVGHAAGIMTVTQKNAYTRNYGGDLRSGEKKWGLDYKFDQLQESLIGRIVKTDKKNEKGEDIYTIIENGINLSDPIANGLLQGFIQKTNGLSKYVNQEGLFKSIESENEFFNDYKRYVSDNINNEFNAAKAKTDDTGVTKSFNEYSESAYKNKKEMDMYNAAQLEQTISIDDNANLGVEFDKFAKTPESSIFFPSISEIFGLEKPTITQEEKDALYQGLESPFVLANKNGTDYVSLNQSYDDAKYQEALQKKYPNDWQKYYDKAMLEKQRLYALTSNGSGIDYTTRRDVSTAFVPANGLGDSWWSLVNSDKLVGQSAQNIGQGLVGTLGTTPFNLSDLGKDLTYGGVEGGITYMPNTVPNNLYTVVIENNKAKYYQHASTEWDKLSDAKKTELYNLSMEQAKKDNRAGTKFLSGGDIANKISKSTKPAGEWEQKLLATFANDPNIGTNFIYAAPVMPMQTAKFEGSKANIIKALEKITVNVEMPSAYATDTRYKEEYWKTPNITTKEKKFKTGEGPVEGITAIKSADAITKENNLNPTQTAEFNKHYSTIMNSNASMGQKTILVKDALIKTKINYKGGFNYNSQNVILTPVKVAENGKLNPFAEKFVSISNKPSAKDKDVMTDVLYIQTDVTPIVSQNAVNAQNIMSTQTTISNRYTNTGKDNNTRNPFSNVGIQK